MSTTTVYFVRHAHSPWVPNREADRPLSDRGRADAARIADRLAERPVDAVLSSPYARARETVEPVADRHGLDVEIEEGFRERRLTDGPAESIGETFESAIDRVWSDPTFAWPGGESNEGARERGVRAIERTLARHRGETVVVGTHGNLLTLLLGHYDDRFGFAFWRDELTTPDVYETRFEAAAMVHAERRWTD